MRYIALLLFIACAHAPDPLVTSGETLHFAASRFVDTAHLMDEGYEKGHISIPTYQGWADFVARFKPAFHTARVAWEAAVLLSNAESKKDVLDGIRMLIEELAAWYVEASDAVQLLTNPLSR
jgi:hypothetical protein